MKTIYKQLQTLLFTKDPCIFMYIMYISNTLIYNVDLTQDPLFVGKSRHKVCLNRIVVGNYLCSDYSSDVIFVFQGEQGDRGDIGDAGSSGVAVSPLISYSFLYAMKVKCTVVQLPSVSAHTIADRKRPD